MTTKINPLIVDLYSGKISKDEFIKEYFRDIPSKNKYVSELMEKSIVNEDAIAIDETIALLYTGCFPLNCFTSNLCKLLQSSWHTKHEDIAMLLKQIADPTTVDCLYVATELELEYLNYDDTYQFARKCIKALSAIGNENAIEKLKLLMNSKIIEISEYAKKELRYKGLL